jgi:signal transduction histidine kinase
VFARITFPAIIFAATTFPRMDYSKTQLWSLLLWVPYTLGVIAVDVAHLEALPVLYEAGQGATLLMIGFEVAIIALFLLAIFSVLRWDRGIRERGSAYIIGALALGIFAEVSVAIYPNPNDAFALLGHMFGFASFVLIFLALFRRSIETPYWKLDEAKKVVERTNVELNVEKNKSERYFDFLAHDIANILAPVMSYGVMISSHPTAPGDIRRYSRKIVDQTDRAAKFITNMRRLSEAERVSTTSPPSYDLGANLKMIEEKFKKEHGKRRISFKVNAPYDQISVAGGEYVEDILFSILNNSAKHTKAEEVRIAMMIMPLKGEDGKDFWRISVEDEGPGIPDSQKLSMTNPFDASQRFSRGVGSTISFMSAITKHFGGRLWIEDRVPGTPAKGTRVVVALPSVLPNQNN